MNKLFHLKNTFFLIGFILWCLPQCLWSQKYLTRTGQITFQASVPTFEPIKAINQGTTAILDTQTGELAVLALVRGFRFRVALMEEHFNENYIESDTYPKTSFRGKIVDFNLSKLMDNLQKYTLQGELSLHGVNQNIEIPVFFSIQGEQIKITADFSVRSEDYAIEIPKLVRKQIAEIVEISVDLTMNPK